MTELTLLVPPNYHQKLTQIILVNTSMESYQVPQITTPYLIAIFALIFLPTDNFIPLKRHLLTCNILLELLAPDPIMVKQMLYSL